MKTTDSVRPVRKSVTVDTSPQRAFELFTEGMVRWWGPQYSINASPIEEIVMEPMAGGRWFERGEDGSECEWGKVLSWEPPKRLLLVWQIVPGEPWRFDPDVVTELEIRFADEGNGRTRVDLEHRNLEGFGEQASMAREIFDAPDAWRALLDRFSAEAG